MASKRKDFWKFSLRSRSRCCRKCGFQAEVTDLFEVKRGTRFQEPGTAKPESLHNRTVRPAGVPCATRFPQPPGDAQAQERRASWESGLHMVFLGSFTARAFHRSRSSRWNTRSFHIFRNLVECVEKSERNACDPAVHLPRLAPKALAAVEWRVSTVGVTASAVTDSGKTGIRTALRDREWIRFQTRLCW